MESTYVPVGAEYDDLPPEAGQFILVNNAGGSNQSPGSYGYTRTEVLDVEHRAIGFGLLSRRVKTQAFGWGCWSTDPTVKVFRVKVDTHIHRG